MEHSLKLIPRELKNYNFPEASFLSKEQQIAYEEACKQFSNGKARESLKIPQKGSNLFKILLLNQIGIRTVTLLELDFIAEQNPDFLKGFYEDSPSVVLRSNRNSYSTNDYLAKSLAKLISKKNFNQPIIINGLKIKEDNNSPYGLNFEAADNFEFFKAPDFSHKNNTRRFSRINPDYTIEFDDKASRTLYTRNSGLSGLYLNRYLDLYSGSANLANSNDNGRVVVVSAKGTSQKILDEQVAKLQKIRDEEIADINKRYKQAESVLKNK